MRVPAVLVRVHFVAVAFLDRRCLPDVEPAPEGGVNLGCVSRAR